MDTARARSDLAFVESIVRRTSERIDAHAFHCVHWGVIVLLWYPLANWFEARGMLGAYIGIGVASLLLGTALSVWRGAQVSRHPRVPGADTSISRQLGRIVLANLCAAFVLSWCAPASGFIDGRNVPIVWGLVYANMAFMMGVAYSVDFMISGIAIFAGCLAAIFLQPYNGYILGPFMGLGMIVPGLRAEARTRALQRADEQAGAVAEPG